MPDDFSEEQVGKRVVSQTGEEIGTVRDVRGGDLHVTVEGDVDADLLDELGWDGTVEQDAHHLPGRYVANVDEDTIRLRV
ncbi:hypothetical protein ACFQPA_01410 [Halomarina halobia]|uniref:PRC-barrel domain containing protein n=1 Tax=Halomarina halobia TaxID=3033386 RepID=A0ABD6A6P4_9EURY|nr:hypothetical protein [Halomarina sp. PSR21]